MATETAAYDHPVTAAPTPAHEQAEKADQIKLGETESIAASKETEVKMAIVKESSKSQENQEEKQNETAAVEDEEKKSDKPIVNAASDATEEAPGHEALMSEKAKEQTEPPSVKENEKTAENETAESVPEGDKSPVEEQLASRSMEKKPEEQPPTAEANDEKLGEAMKSITDVPESSVEITENEGEMLEGTDVKEPEPELVIEASQEEPVDKEILKGVTEATETADVAEAPQCEMVKEQEASPVETVEEEKPKEQSESKEAAGKPEETLDASEVNEAEAELVKEKEASQVESIEKEKVKEESDAKGTVGMSESSVEVADKPEKAFDAASVEEMEKKDPKGESKEDEKPKEQSEAVKIVDLFGSSSTEANSNQEPGQKVAQEKEIPQAELVEDAELKPIPQVEEQSEAVKVANVVDSSAESNPDQEPKQEAVQEKEIPQAESIEDLELKMTPGVEENLEEQSDPRESIGVVKSSNEATAKPEETLEANQVKEPELEEVENREILQEPTAVAEKRKETSDANAGKEPDEEVVKEGEILQAETVEELKQGPASQVEDKLEEQSELTKIIELVQKSPEATKEREEISKGNQEKEAEQEELKEKETSHAETAEEGKVEHLIEVEEKPKAAAEASETMKETMEVNPSTELEQAALSNEQEEAPQEENIPNEQSDVTEVVEKACKEIEPDEIQAAGIKNSVARDGEEKRSEVQRPPVSESSEGVATDEKAAQAEQKEAAVQPSLTEVAEGATLEVNEKEVCPATQVKEVVKDVVGVAGEVENAHEANDVKTQEEKQQEAEEPKDESIAIPTTTKEVTRSTLGDIFNKEVEAMPENKEDMEEKTLASVESKGNETDGEKLTEVAANEETEELEGANAAGFDTIKDKDVGLLQNLESGTKDVEHTKESEDQPKEDVPAKKHSNNILSKVKQSLVKAKKAITGKSHQTKTTSS